MLITVQEDKTARTCESLGGRWWGFKDPLNNGGFLELNIYLLSSFSFLAWPGLGVSC